MTKASTTQFINVAWRDLACREGTLKTRDVKHPTQNLERFVLTKWWFGAIMVTQRLLIKYTPSYPSGEKDN